MTAHGRARPAAIPDHPLICRDEPVLVTTTARLTELIDELRSAGSFAYDTEFIGERSYYPQLCLIQLATSRRVALVDPLADVDLSALWSLIADTEVETVVHAGSQDLEPVVRLSGEAPGKVFDTQIAAGLAGLRYPLSLAKAMRELVGVSLGKGLTFTDWDRRPLSAVQMRYAADDVRYLPAARAALHKRLSALGHTRMAAAECQTLTDASLYRYDRHVQCLRVRGARSLRSGQLAILRELVAVRDQGAREQDVPPRTFLRDEVLLALTRNPVRSLADLAGIRGLPRPVERAYGKRLLAATRAALELPPDECPIVEADREHEAERIPVDSLAALATGTCLGSSVDPGLVATRADLAQLYRAHLNGRSVSKCRVMQGWRKKLLGQVLIDILNGSAGVRLRWREGRLDADIQGPPDEVGRQPGRTKGDG